MRDEAKAAIEAKIKDIRKDIQSFNHFLSKGVLTSNHLSDWAKKKADQITVNFFTLHALMEQLTTDELREVYDDDAFGAE